MVQQTQKRQRSTMTNRLLFTVVREAVPGQGTVRVPWDAVNELAACQRAPRRRPGVFRFS